MEASEIATLTENIKNCLQTSSQNVSTQTVSTQTETGEYVRYLEKTITNQNTLISSLFKKLSLYALDLHSFKNNDEKTRYYTGLTEYVTLETIYKFVEPHLKHSNNNVLTKSQMLILCLMKIRLGLQFTDLAYRFNVSTQTVSRTFYHVINILYIKLKGLISRPEAEEVKRTMPKAFQKNFGNRVAHILDATEIFIEKPSNPQTAIQCFSFYKNHHTIKFLLSIVPQGVIEFKSDAYGGRASDDFITAHSGYFDLLDPHDLVLADKGFTLKECFEIRRASLETPAFVCNKEQLHPIDVERTRKVANVRVHVERVIGLLKRKYLIFHQIIPMSMLCKQGKDVSAIDKIMTICCALCNLCPSVTY